MQIINKNLNEELLKLIETKARYQKVLLLYDNSVTQFEINLLHNIIKESCIFNKMCIQNLNKQELFNGYKIIIYYCNGESIINLNFNRDEFINIYYPTNSTLLPFYLNSNSVLNNNCYLFLQSQFIDLNLYSSLYFNNFLNYLNNILNQQQNNCLPPTQTMFADIHTILSELPTNYSFEDLKLITCCNIDYQELSFAHLIIINGFITFLESLHNKNLRFTDVYKQEKENYKLIDKLYTQLTSNSLNLLNLNYLTLLNLANQTKTQILNCLTSTITTTSLNSLIFKIHNYCKNSNDVFLNLYLYDIIKI